MRNFPKPNFSTDAFVGTAEYYAHYRIPYPQRLIDDLIKRTSPLHQGILLDIACGPGRIAIPLAPKFSKVLANDAEPEMIAAGKRESIKKKINNIEWRLGKAEELNIEIDSIDLITVGEAFHRLDQNIITRLALKWLKPGCYLALIGYNSIFEGTEPWHDIIIKIVNKWIAINSLEKDKSLEQRAEREPKQYKHVLQEYGFEECQVYSFTIPHYWTAESIIGYLYSTSVCSKKILGKYAEEFESEIKTVLNRINKYDRFFENMICGYTLGRKPLL